MIGIDIVDLYHFSKKISKKIFIKKIFTQNEIDYAQKNKRILETLAGIFAAKEAVLKAFNLNVSYILRKKIEILHEIDGKPYYKLESDIYKDGLSISHDGNFAVSVCKIDKYIKRNFDINFNLEPRKKESNKGDYGRIAFLGGSSGMSGSIYMSSIASLKTGCGLSYIICPKSISNILQIKCVESIIKEISCDKFLYSKDILDEIFNSLEKIDVLCIGPGMGIVDNIDKLIKEIIKGFNSNILIDADGLNAISKDISILNLKNKMVLTPHIMEFSRLLNMPINEINQNKEFIAKSFAKKYDQILVLKGHETIVTDGKDIYINDTGNPGMATAGSGDVLSGIISTLLYRLDPFEAAKMGVFIHGLAGDIASEKLSEESLMATDIINNIHEVFKIFRSKHA